MFKRTLSAMAVGAVLIVGSMTSAQAIEITAGNYKITFDNFDVGTVGYGNTAGIACTTVAECNNKAALPGLSPARGTSGDTAGILSVVSIRNLVAQKDEYIRGTASTLDGVTVGPYLTGVFSGLDDYYVEIQSGTLGATTTALAQGGSFSIFSNSSDWNSDLGPLGAGVNLDTKQYAGISGGNLFLSGVFAQGVIGVKPEATYLTNYNNSTLAGNGQGFLDFTGGFAYNLFNTNKTKNNIGGFNDAFLTVTFDDNNGDASSKGWDVKSSGQISGNAGQQVPEPGSLALISLAMLGLGATTARRRSKKG